MILRALARSLAALCLLAAPIVALLVGSALLTHSSGSIEMVLWSPESDHFRSGELTVRRFMIAYARERMAFTKQAEYRLPDEGIPVTRTAWHTAGLYNARHVRNPGYDTWSIDISVWWTSLILLPPTLALTIPVLIRILRRRKRACPKCSYSLRGNVSGTCPECGTTTKAPATTN